LSRLENVQDSQRLKTNNINHVHLDAHWIRESVS